MMTGASGHSLPEWQIPYFGDSETSAIPDLLFEGTSILPDLEMFSSDALEIIALLIFIIIALLIVIVALYRRKPEVHRDVLCDVCMMWMHYKQYEQHVLSRKHCRYTRYYAAL